MMLVELIMLPGSLLIAGGFGWYLYHTRNRPQAVRMIVRTGVAAAGVIAVLWVMQKSTTHITSFVFEQMSMPATAVGMTCIGALVIRRLDRRPLDDTS